MMSKGKVGFYGKLPIAGDFISRRLPKDFIGAIDTWLQHGISVSKDVLGDRWLDLYLTSPVWRFAFQSGVCGKDTWVGIMMPSVDKVGRYFPLILACKIDEEKRLGLVLVQNNEWFTKLEKIALAGLDEVYSLEEFNEAVFAIDQPLVKNSIDQAERVDDKECASTHLISETPLNDDITPSDALLLTTFKTMELINNDRYSVWLQIADDKKGAVSLYKDLPAAHDYVKMIG